MRCQTPVHYVLHIGIGVQRIYQVHVAAVRDLGEGGADSFEAFAEAFAAMRRYQDQSLGGCFEAVAGRCQFALFQAIANP